MIKETISLLIIVLTLHLQMSSAESEKNEQVQDTDVRLQKNKPTVYITFEYAGKRQPLHTDESNKGVWLRLHNNTIWPIRFQGFSVDDSFSTPAGIEKEAGVLYGIEVVGDYKDGKAPIANRSHTHSIKSIPSGSSIVFSLPREHLATGLAIYVNYNFEWEVERGRIRSGEPKHRVSFYSYDLPRK